MPSEGLSKAYRPDEHEGRIWQRWIDVDAFHADPHRVVSGEAEPYCILIPPPNVTAALHLGHALNNSLQDVLARAHRMMGFETLWMPGTDHAGIATQTVVDKRLVAEGKPGIAQLRRVAGGREQFVAEVQAFKDEYEQRITDQLKAMGCSCDWKRQRFTMDPVCARAVREAFFRLFQAGLIERGKRLVNWDPVSQTALADDEVEMKEVDGAFYYMRYPLVHPPENANDRLDAQEVTWSELAARGYPGAHEMPEEEPAWVTVATTRPETYLGDTAVAVNPKDPRSRALAGLKVQLPIVGRIIPIVEDEYVVLPLRFPWETEEQAEMRRDEDEPIDPKALMATGFLKVTPAHDPNDWEIGRRHGLDVINVMAPDASISDAHGWNAAARGEEGHIFFGKSREEARELVIKEFKARRLLEQVKPHKHSVGHSYRSHAMIEPYLSDQWYVKVTDDRLRGEAQRALRQDQRSEESLRAWKESRPGERNDDGDASMSFYPARYAKTYEMWHDNLRDWCISRQLWWGHRIPVWSISRFMPTDDRLHPGSVQIPYPWKCQNLADAREFQDSFNGYLKQRRLAWCARSTSNVAHTWDVDLEWGSSPTQPGKLDWTEVTVCVRNESDTEAISFLEGYGFEQDPDVLDTWFSSALWPLSTLGWPDASAAASDTGIADFPALLEAFNPTSVLCTAREIITLWVSRMVMFNRFFRSEEMAKSQSSKLPNPDSEVWPSGNLPSGHLPSGPVPFKDVFIHAMIQDGEGRKMSKSLGNGVDPLDIIHTHGADAMRFTLVQMTTQTQDVRMPVERDEKSGKNTSPKFDIGRNFCNKLWNAARFALSNLADVNGRQDAAPPGTESIDPKSLSLADRWMLSRLAEATEQASAAIAGYQFNVYAQTMYDLLWRDFCDWYLEAIKPTVKANPAQQACLRAVLDAILRLLHPITPFITEAIHEKVAEVALPAIDGLDLSQAKKGVLATAGWPRVSAALRDSDATASFERVRSLVSSIRDVRAKHQVHDRRKVTLHTDAALVEQIGGSRGLVETLAGVAFDDGSPDGVSAAFAYDQREYRLSNLADAVDAGAERERLSRELDALDKSIFALEKRLQNPGYTEKAPAHLVQQTRDELTQKQSDREAIRKAMEAVG